MTIGAEIHHRIVFGTRAATRMTTGSAIRHQIAAAMATRDVIYPAIASAKTTGVEIGFQITTGRTPAISAMIDIVIRLQGEAVTTTGNVMIAIAHLLIAHLLIAHLLIAHLLIVIGMRIDSETCHKNAIGMMIGGGKIPRPIVSGKKTVQCHRRHTLPEVQ